MELMGYHLIWVSKCENGLGIFFEFFLEMIFECNVLRMCVVVNLYCISIYMVDK